MTHYMFFTPFQTDSLEKYETKSFDERTERKSVRRTDENEYSTFNDIFLLLNCVTKLKAPGSFPDFSLSKRTVSPSSEDNDPSTSYRSTTVILCAPLKIVDNDEIAKFLIGLKFLIRQLQS